MTRPRTLALVLAGGAGSRMGVLTDRRAKPALPFGGLYRLIDFPLSNCANSGMDDVWVLQQYQPHALEEHLANGRPTNTPLPATGGMSARRTATGRPTRTSSAAHPGSICGTWDGPSARGAATALQPTS